MFLGSIDKCSYIHFLIKCVYFGFGEMNLQGRIFNVYILMFDSCPSSGDNSVRTVCQTWRPCPSGVQDKSYQARSAWDVLDDKWQQSHWDQFMVEKWRRNIREQIRHHSNVSLHVEIFGYFSESVLNGQISLEFFLFFWSLILRQFFSGNKGQILCLA